MPSVGAGGPRNKHEPSSNTCAAFKTAEDQKTFADSAWSQEQKARYVEKAGDLPAVGRFELPELPTDKAPPAYLQYTTLHIEDESHHVEARKAFEDVIKALGKEAFGGRTVDEPFIGLGIIGWDSLEVSPACYTWFHFDHG